MTAIGGAEKDQPDFTDMYHGSFAKTLRAAGTAGINEALLTEAADRIDRFDRFTRLLGLLAPGGTAPRTAIEQIYDQSAGPDTTESPIIMDLRDMLQSHWGDWTPALRTAEGLSAAEPESPTAP